MWRRFPRKKQAADDLLNTSAELAKVHTPCYFISTTNPKHARGRKDILNLIETCGLSYQQHHVSCRFRQPRCGRPKSVRNGLGKSPTNMLSNNI